MSHGVELRIGHDGKLCLDNVVDVDVAQVDLRELMPMLCDHRIPDPKADDDESEDLEEDEDAKK